MKLTTILGAVMLAVMLGSGLARADELLDAEAKEQKNGSTRAKGSYTVTQVTDNKVKIRVQLNVRKSGVSGTGRGFIVVAFNDSEGNALLPKREKGLTVGADALDGVADKDYDETFTIVGQKAKKVIADGFEVAFTVFADKDTFGVPTSPTEWKDTLGKAWKEITGGLAAGGKAEIAGWIIKKIKP